MLLTKYNVDSIQFGAHLKPSQLKPYRNTLKMVYDNPEFKTIYKKESDNTVLRMLSYLEILRKKSEETIRENCEKLKSTLGKNYLNIDEAALKDTTKQFVNENIESVKKLSLLPTELQPSREALEFLTSLTLKNR